MRSDPEITFLIPCLNEEKTLPYVLNEIHNQFSSEDFSYEILVADNGSTDLSTYVAESLGARVVQIPLRGYGAALLGGIENSLGDFVIMGDADGSYHFEDSKEMIAKLRSDSDMVIGNRFQGGIEKGAMPFLHRYLGNPVLSFLARLFYSIPLGDFHCGLRGFKKQSVSQIGLNSSGMEFASELIVKAKLSNLTISEVPVRLSKDKRDRAPHLRTWRDGWRHLKFLFSYSPEWALKIPASISLVMACIPILLTLFGSNGIGLLGVNLSYKSSVFSMALSLLSLNLFWAFFVAKELERNNSAVSNRTLTAIAFASLALLVLGLIFLSIQAVGWATSGFAQQTLGSNLYLGILSAFLISLGATSLAFSLVVGFIRIKIKNSQPYAN